MWREVVFTFLFIYIHIIEIWKHSMNKISRLKKHRVCIERVFYSAYKIPSSLHNIHLNTSQPLSYQEGTHFAVAIWAGS